jgi:hypothetical protein
MFHVSQGNPKGPGNTPQFNAVQNWVNAVANWNFEDLSSLLADKYTHSTFPVGEGAPRNKAQDLEHYRAIADLLNHDNMMVRC